MQQVADAGKRFIETYQRIWDTRDGVQIAKLYHAPCLTVRGDGFFAALNTVEEIAQFFQTVAETYYRQGWEGSAVKDLSVEPLGARSALITLTWNALRPDGSLAKEWRQSYNICRFGDVWQIVLSTFHLAD